MPLCLPCFSTQGVEYYFSDARYIDPVLSDDSNPVREAEICPALCRFDTDGSYLKKTSKRKNASQHILELLVCCL